MSRRSSARRLSTSAMSRRHRIMAHKEAYSPLDEIPAIRCTAIDGRFRSQVRRNNSKTVNFAFTYGAGTRWAPR